MIGVIVEGAGEIPAIQKLLDKVQKTRPILGRPLLADLQPKANPRVIARSAKSAVNQLVSRGATKVVVLIDREDHPCSVSFASDLHASFHAMYNSCHFSIVVKNKSIENWLVSDLVALERMPGRFSLTPELRRAVPGRADELHNPARLLSACSVRHEYHKGQDPSRIADQMDVLRTAQNSRSFRKFLREVGDSRYAVQSKQSI